MLCNREDCDCPFAENDNCTNLRHYGDCEDGVGFLVSRYEEILRRIRESVSPHEVDMLLTEAEMLDKTISDCVLRDDFLVRAKHVRETLF